MASAAWSFDTILIFSDNEAHATGYVPLLRKILGSIINWNSGYFLLQEALDSLSLNDHQTSLRSLSYVGILLCLSSIHCIFLKILLSIVDIARLFYLNMKLMHNEKFLKFLKFSIYINHPWKKPPICIDLLCRAVASLRSQTLRASTPSLVDTHTIYIYIYIVYIYTPRPLFPDMGRRQLILWYSLTIMLFSQIWWNKNDVTMLEEFSSRFYMDL